MKLRVILLFTICLAGGPLAADHLPTAPPPPLGIGSVARLIASAGPINPYLEVLGDWNNPSAGLGYRSFTVGGYVRPMANLKIGAFYRVQAGARHNDDWVATGVAAPGWIWQTTTDRYEQVLILDASPRFLLPTAGKNSVFMLKSRWEYNLFNNQQSLLVRPGITRFIMRERRPVAEIAFAYAAYLALNFGETRVYSYAPYLDFSYHLSPDLSLALGASAQTRIWTTSAEVLATTPDHYAVAFPSFAVRIGLVYRPRL